MSICGFQYITDDLFNSTVKSALESVLGDVRTACDDLEDSLAKEKNVKVMAKVGEMCTKLIGGVEMKFDDFDEVVANMTDLCSEYLAAVGSGGGGSASIMVGSFFYR